jgi:CubicO group peptidase (beta-lactamase class C family)
MKRQILLLIIISITFCSFGQIKESQAIDSIFSEWNKPDVPGCALGIIKDGTLIYSKGYGLANMEYDIPNSGSAVFRIGSTSKQFTAACIVLLAEQGKLSLDNNLKSLFPDFPSYAEKITIRQLLNHTSGIRDYLMISYLKGLSDDDYYTDGDVMNWLTNQSDLNFNPGEEFLYSNSGYWLLGQIVKKVSGKNMADFANEEIFGPLAMNNTHFHNDHTQIVKNRASGYVPSGNNDYKISMTTLDMIGDGGVFTTINDIKKWDDSYYNSNVLSKRFWDMMTQQGILNSGEVIDYASGLDIGEYKGLKTIRHGGAFVGFRAELLRFPEQRLSIAIFANRSDASPSRMANQVADLLLKENFTNIGVENQDQKDVKKDEFVHLKTNELENFSGHYWNNTSSLARKVYVKNDTLIYFRSETNESKLVPISKNEFKMINVQADVVVKFEVNELGENTMSFIANGGKPSISIEYMPKVYTKNELLQLSGRYYSSELDVYYSLTPEGDLLMLYINDSKKSSLSPIMKNLFSNDDYGIFQFNNDDGGRLSSFRLAAGRVKNLNFEKK